MADDTPLSDEESTFKAGSNGRGKRTRPRAPSNKQTFIADAPPAARPTNNTVRREVDNVLSAPSTKKVLTFGASWKNCTDVDFLNKDVKENAESSKEASDPSLDGHHQDAVNTKRHSAPIPSTSNNTAASSTAASDCFWSSSAGASRPSTDASEDSTYAPKERCPGAGVGATSLLPGTAVGSISSGLEVVDKSLPCLPDVDLDGVDLELPASPAASVESDFWADGEYRGTITEVLGDATPSVDAKRLAYAAIDRLMGNGGRRNSGASGNVARDGDQGESMVLESLLLDDMQLRHESGFEASESCSGSTLFKGSTARLPKKLSLEGNISVTPVTSFGVSTNRAGNVGNIESRDADKGSGRGESPLASSLGGDDSISSPYSSDEAAALSPSLWKLVERGDICPFEDCAFTVSAAEEKERAKLDRGGGKAGAASGLGLLGEGKAMSDEGERNRSRCRHFHTLCGCRHTRGAFKGLLFQTNQMDKARNHQRKHAVEAATAAAKMSKMRSSQYPGGTVEHNPSQLSQESEDNPDSSFDGVEMDNDLDADVMGNSERDGSSASAGSFGKRKARTKGRATNIKGDNFADGRRTWTNEESDRLREIMECGEAGGVRKNWTWVAERIGEVGESRKTPSQCKMRWERTLNPCVKKGPWTEEEDMKLKDVAAAMDYKWSRVSKVMGGRTYKQCRERFTNYLKDGLNCGPWTKEENSVLLEMHGKFGNKWAEIARILKDRSENMIKNQFMKLAREKKSETEWGQDYHDGRRGKRCGRNGASRERVSVTSEKQSARVSSQAFHGEGDPKILDYEETGCFSSEGFEPMLPLDESASGPSDCPYLLL